MVSRTQRTNVGSSSRAIQSRGPSPDGGSTESNVTASSANVTRPPQTPSDSRSPAMDSSSMEAAPVDLATQHQTVPSRTSAEARPGARAQIDLANWNGEKVTDDDGPYVRPGALHVDDTVPMRIDFGASLSEWMRGEVVGQNIKRPRRREDETSARAYLATALAPKTVEVLNDRTIFAGDVSQAMRDGLTSDAVISLLEKGAGHYAFTFLNESKATAQYRSPLVTLERILARWGPRTEIATERLVALARSERVKNPEELKSWHMGIGTDGVAADGYATMINDAVDLIEAGHDIALEEMPKGMPGGLGDIIDLTEKVVYQHKRVAGKTLGKSIKKAVKQLAGFGDTPGAPDGFAGIVQIDARQNSHYNGHDNAHFSQIVSELHLVQTNKFDEIQIVLDDRLLVFGNDRRLVRVDEHKESNGNAGNEANA